MLKLEIKLDEKKIVLEQEYSVASIYSALETAFVNCQLRSVMQEDGTMLVYGSGNPMDYGSFGAIITSLKDKRWFMDYVTKWIWYNSDDGENEEDFSVEDVLYFYTKKVSVA